MADPGELQLNDGGDAPGGVQPAPTIYHPLHISTYAQWYAKHKTHSGTITPRSCSILTQ